MPASAKQHLLGKSVAGQLRLAWYDCQPDICSLVREHGLICTAPVALSSNIFGLRLSSFRVLPWLHDFVLCINQALAFSSIFQGVETGGR
jgi:hypothetical protein